MVGTLHPKPDERRTNKKRETGEKQEGEMMNLQGQL
jgi:hypothetical protein